ncbi:MAG: CoA pyrophosphatase [Acidobacteria bacterium]|nr:CoA pyrophosphatase [Acidobacteriota bacterium]
MAEAEAAVAILHARGAEESVLLIRRAEREGDPWSGHWSFPGGRRDPDDSDLLHTALRELSEECGIQLGRERMQAALPHTVAGRKAGRCLLVAPYLFRVDRELPSVLDVREAVEARWVPLCLLSDPARHCLRRVPGQPVEIAYPAVDLEDEVPLWGFTYRVIAEWLGLHAGRLPIERAGFETASRLLELLLSQGLRLEHGFIGNVARVSGAIPVERVLAWFSAPGRDFPVVTALEVRPDSVRVAGLELEEYFIHAS